MKNKSTKFALIGISFLGLCAASPALADGSYSFSVPSTAPDTCCQTTYDHPHANGNATVIMQNTNQKLAAMQLAIIETLRLMTGQISGNTAQQTGAQHTLADQQDDRATVKAVEEHTLKAINAAVTSPSACRIITGSSGGGMAAGKDEIANAYNNQIVAWVDGSSPMSSKGQDDAVLKRLEMHCSKFASQNDVADGVCQAQAAGSLQNADIDPGKSLFANNGPVEALNSDQSMAAQAYIMNSVAPVPFTPLSSSEAQTAEGKLRLQRQQTEISRISMATATAHDLLARRSNLSTDGNLISWAQGTAANMQGYANADYSKGVSYDDWLKLNSQSFLLNADELKNSEESDVTALKSIKNMMAVMTYQQFENYKLLEKIAMNLATQTGILAESTRTDMNFTSAPATTTTGG